MTLLWWIVFHAIGALFWLWILRWGGADWLEGTFLSGFLVSTFAPRWSAEGLRMFALLMLIVCAISFVWGLFMPEMRCWYSGHC
ncbi:hypothetical protein [Acidovorax cavernicola]|uniref:Uncharacterized protein n=1 Tax=Acidovorax cavernicola TaxID=1675792 RepID=A0A9X8D0L7_9BURK|nr:hypothetical protein [Acidovorax cavernicola]RIX75223.1 hypothetical protein D3H34_25755 [Acidovorax cavernicola]